MPPRGGRARAGRSRGGMSRSAASAAADAPSETQSSAIESTPSTTSQPIPIPDDPRPDTVTLAPAPTPATGRPSATPAPAAAPSSSRGKFKPKAVRRGEEERIRRAEEIAKLQQQRNAEEARFSSRYSHGRGRGRGRGRGGFRGMSRGSTAAGPLSAGMAFGGAGSVYQGGYGASNEMDNSRINADMLYSVVDYSDEETPASKGNQKKKRAPMPMGIRRVEHKEEQVTMTSAAEIQAQERGAEQAEEDESSDGLFVDEERTNKEAGRVPAKDEEVWEHAVPKTRVKVKDENVEMADFDQIPERGIKAADSPEQKKKGLLKDGDKKAKKKGDTEEELVAEDLAHLVNLFSIGGNDPEKKDVVEGQAGSSLEGHMFLFQFPPVLPPLKSTRQELAKAVIKPDPGDEEDDEIMFAPKKKAPAVNIDLTDVPDKVKEEEHAEENGEEDDGVVDLRKEGGFVGNLVVRKSGKVELSWGGKTLVLVPGTQANFLSTAVLLEEAEDVKPQPGQVSGAAYGMGKIQGSFALVPTWGDEEEWEVDPKDLEIGE